MFVPPGYSPLHAFGMSSATFATTGLILSPRSDDQIPLTPSSTGGRALFLPVVPLFAGGFGSQVRGRSDVGVRFEGVSWQSKGVEGGV